MAIEYFIVWDNGERAIVYGLRNGTRTVQSGQYTDALVAKGRRNGIIGWRKRSTAERYLAHFSTAPFDFNVPIKIIELEIA